MAAALIYSAAPVKLNSTVMAATDIKLSPNIANQVYQHSGNLFPSSSILSGAIPRLTFKTPIVSALTTIGTGILALSNLDFMLAKFSNSTYARLATSTHRKWNAALGAACVTGWSVGQNGICMADVEVVPLVADGVTHPLTPTDNNAMMILASEPLLHTLGPLSVNGTVITGLNQLSVSMGHTIDVRVSDGDLYPRNAALLAGAPSITGEHLDPVTLISALSLIGVNISASVIAYWKSFDATTQIVSVSNSISATIGLGRIFANDVDANQNNPAKASISVVPLSTTTTHPMVISTSATAPAT